MKLSEQLEAAKAEVRRLENLASKATCAEAGHRWVLMGGTACCCDLNSNASCCSLPVHECSVCKDCDYGDNIEADAILANCKIGVYEDEFFI